MASSLRRPGSVGAPTSSEGVCSAAYSLVNSWPGEFQGQVTMTNTGTAALNSWPPENTLAVRHGKLAIFITSPASPRAERKLMTHLLARA